MEAVKDLGDNSKKLPLTLGICRMAETRSGSQLPDLQCMASSRTCQVTFPYKYSSRWPEFERETRIKVSSPSNRLGFSLLLFFVFFFLFRSCIRQEIDSYEKECVDVIVSDKFKKVSSFSSISFFSNFYMILS